MRGRYELRISIVRKYDMIESMKGTSCTYPLKDLALIC